MGPVSDPKATARASGETKGLRPMKRTDIEAVVGLISRAMNPLEGEQAETTFRFHFSCRENQLDDGRSYYVYEPDSTIEGIVGLHHYHWGPAENVWLAWFAVSPKSQGTGVGAQLLQAVRAEALRHGFVKLFIETYSTPEFDRARAFYRRQGFVEVGHVHSYLADGSDMVVYLRELANDK